MSAHDRALARLDEIELLDAIDAGDPERAHGEADLVLLAVVPLAVQRAYERVIDRSPWWASA